MGQGGGQLQKMVGLLVHQLRQVPDPLLQGAVLGVLLLLLHLPLQQVRQGLTHLYKYIYK